jgi:hypothetical protein
MPLWWHTKFAKHKSGHSILVYKKNDIYHFIHKWWKDSYVFSHTGSHKSDASQHISASFNDYCFWNVMPCISFQVFIASVTQMTVLPLSFGWPNLGSNLHRFPFRSSNWPNSEKFPTRQFQQHKYTSQTLQHRPQPNSVILNIKAEHVPLRHQKTSHYAA